MSEAGIGFCFARSFHPALRFLGPARAALAVPTTFNYLGPLANPARVRRQALGVSDPAMAQKMLAVLAELGAERALVFHGDDGLDELTTTTTSQVHELTAAGDVRSYEIDPTALGMPRVETSALAGGDADTNADAVRSVLAGEPGPVRDIAVLNAAAALVVADRAENLPEGLDRATAAVDDGRAQSALDVLVRVSADAAQGS